MKNALVICCTLVGATLLLAAPEARAGSEDGLSAAPIPPPGGAPSAYPGPGYGPAGYPPPYPYPAPPGYPPPGYAPPAEPPEPPPPETSFSLTLSPIHLLFPVVELLNLNIGWSF